MKPRLVSAQPNTLEVDNRYDPFFLGSTCVGIIARTKLYPGEGKKDLYDGQYDITWETCRGEHSLAFRILSISLPLSLFTLLYCC
jgi:hypothetical protein